MPTARLNSTPNPIASHPARLISVPPRLRQNPALTAPTPATQIAAIATPIHTARRPVIPLARRSWQSAAPRPPSTEILDADGKQASRGDRAACRLPQRPRDQLRRRADL